MRPSSWLGKDEQGKLKLQAARPGSSEEAQNRILHILEEGGEITGYNNFEPVDKHLMLCFWATEGLKELLGPAHWQDFCEFFMHKATYPDYIRRAREILVSSGRVEVPNHVKRRMKEKAQAMKQTTFAGMRP